jgi:hypothetical protein
MRVFTAFVICFISLNGLSQSFRLSASAMYVTSDEVTGTYNRGSSYSGIVKAGFQWGAGAEYLFNDKYGAEFTFQYQNTSIPLTYVTSPVTKLQDRTLELGWLMLKCNRYLGNKTNKLQGFLGLGGGICMVNTYNLPGYSKSYFAIQGNAGMIYWPANFIGIKLNGQYQISPEGVGDAFHPDKQTTLGIKSASPLSQFGIGAGLVFVLDGLADSK